jgi:hypothetical protein
MKTSLFAILVCFATASSAFPGTFTVLSAEDSGPGTLRQAILDAIAGDTIGFGLPAPSTITLTSGELRVDKDLEIVGPGKDDLTIARSSAADAAEFRIFHISAFSSVTLSGMTITNGKPDNFTDGGNGGGILNDSGCNLTVSGVEISGNAPVHGGGGPSGGGVYNAGTLTLTGSTVSNNSTGGVFGGGGGGLWNQGTCIITGCTISGNDKGGIINLGSLTVTSSTISGNFSSSSLPPSSGGIVNGAEASLINCTITGNSSVLYVGGIDNYGTMRVKNCIIALNTAPNSVPSDPDVRGIFTSDGYNLIGDGSGATIAPAMGDQIGTAGFPIDPMLGPLAANGGPTETHALLPGSPAIDKGGPVDGVTTDQRGRFRPVDDPAIAAAEGGDESDIGAFEMQAGQALNISTRLRVLTGENILDGGFIITDTEPKKVFIRGLGPSLASQGVPGALPNPFLELHHDVDIIAANDNWRSNQEAEIEATGIPPGDDAESAIIMTLWPGAYTAILEDLSGNSGIGLIEVYDLDAGAVSNLANISTRGFVDSGDNVMIGGFIVGAGEGLPNQIIVRAIGPSLSSSDIANPLQDPDLELRDQSGTLIASNDNWKDTQQAEIEATGVAPADDREAAIVRTLTSGPYTAIVRGVNETTGVALVEVFDLH